MGLHIFRIWRLRKIWKKEFKNGKICNQKVVTILPKATKMGSLIGQGIEYDVEGRGRGRERNWEASSRYPAKIDLNILIALLNPPPPPQECIELHVQEWSDRSNVFPLMLPLSPWQSIHISGTSSKLGRNIAFHHCTLLLDVDEILLKSLLHPSYVSFF